MSDQRVMDARHHAKQVANAEIAAALLVLVLVVIFVSPKLWRRARAHLAGPVRMLDPKG